MDSLSEVLGYLEYRSGTGAAANEPVSESTVPGARADNCQPPLKRRRGLEANVTPDAEISQVPEVAQEFSVRENVVPRSRVATNQQDQQSTKIESEVSASKATVKQNSSSTGVSPQNRSNRLASPVGHNACDDFRGHRTRSVATRGGQPSLITTCKDESSLTLRSSSAKPLDCSDRSTAGPFEPEAPSPTVKVIAPERDKGRGRKRGGRGNVQGARADVEVVKQDPGQSDPLGQSTASQRHCTGDEFLQRLMVRRVARTAMNEKEAKPANETPVEKAEQATGSSQKVRTTPNATELLTIQLQELSKVREVAEKNGWRAGCETVHLEKMELLPAPPPASCWRHGRSAVRTRAVDSSVANPSPQLADERPQRIPLIDAVRFPTDALCAARASDLWEFHRRALTAEVARARRRISNKATLNPAEEDEEDVQNRFQRRFQDEASRRVLMRRQGACPKADVFDTSQARVTVSRAMDGILPARCMANEFEAFTFIPCADLGSLLQQQAVPVLGQWVDFDTVSFADPTAACLPKDFWTCGQIAQIFGARACSPYVGRLARGQMTRAYPFLLSAGLNYAVCDGCGKWVAKKRRRQHSSHCVSDVAGRLRQFCQFQADDLGVTVCYKHLPKDQLVEIRIEADLIAAARRVHWACFYEPTSLRCAWRLVQDITASSLENRLPEPRQLIADTTKKMRINRCRNHAVAVNDEADLSSLDSCAGESEESEDDFQGTMPAHVPASTQTGAIQAPTEAPQFTFRNSVCTARAAQPNGFARPLTPLQLHSLGWMLRRERASKAYTSTQTLRQKIAESDVCVEMRFEREFASARGGILADARGYGKTACMIALIASSIGSPLTDELSVEEWISVASRRVLTSATLVVTPPNLFDQWVAELRKFLDPMTAVSILQIPNHGKLKSLTVSDFVTADVILVSSRLFFSEAYQRYFDEICMPGLKIYTEESLRQREDMVRKRREEASAKLSKRQLRNAQFEKLTFSQRRPSFMEKIRRTRSFQPGSNTKQNVGQIVGGSNGPAPGDLVRLCGLVAKPELNGVSGRLQSLSSRGKWICEIEKDGSPHNVRVWSFNFNVVSPVKKKILVKDEDPEPEGAGVGAGSEQPASSGRPDQEQGYRKETGKNSKDTGPPLQLSRYYMDLRARKDYLPQRQLDLQRRMRRTLREGSLEELVCSPALFEMFHFRRIVFDEFHEIARSFAQCRSSGGSGISNATLAPLHALHALEGRFHWGLTATPLVSNAADVAEMAALLRVFVPPNDQAQAQRFLDEWMTGNSWDDAGIPVEESLVEVLLTEPEFALYARQRNQLAEISVDGQGAAGASSARQATERRLLHLCSFFDPPIITNCKASASPAPEARARDPVEVLAGTSRSVREAFEASSAKSLRCDVDREAVVERNSAREALQSVLPTTMWEADLACAHAPLLDVLRLGEAAAQVSEARLLPELTLLETDLRRLAQTAADTAQPGGFAAHSAATCDECQSLAHPMAKVRRLAKAKDQATAEEAQLARQVRFLGAMIDLVDLSASDLDAECPGCLRKVQMRMASVLPCGHRFHRQCVEAALASTGRCPIALCRRSFTLDLVTTFGPNNSLTVPWSDVLPARRRFGSKISKVVDIVKGIKASEGPLTKVLVLAEWDFLTSQIEAALKTNGITPLVLRGHLPRRQRVIARFSDYAEENSVLLLALAQTPTGVNLACAHHVLLVHPVHGDADANAAYELKAIGHVRRQGQLHTVRVHRFVCRGTVEETMVRQQPLDRPWV